MIVPESMVPVLSSGPHPRDPMQETEEPRRAPQESRSGQKKRQICRQPTAQAKHQAQPQLDGFELARGVAPRPVACEEGAGTWMLTAPGVLGTDSERVEPPMSPWL